ncbi:hypothetical protein [Melittangium boletus]|uniref:Uncharacterized protein n=1 Tax=Melittangium boletus DSM 14713 TaxID=1294270 RepID=A0A250IPQ3_9BACT|nr:hypothetical protein [Melittangium boletus]ATB33212.1 hypothetical protein MEBOL_006701 [Melittangium boletus DSM 14713]
MSDMREWKGQCIGPYRIGERYPDVPEDECRLHEAHHLETGEPALAVIPPSGEDWGLSTPWSLRTTHFPDPGVLVVDAEPSSHAPALTTHELTLGSIRVSGALASLDARGGAQMPFSRKTPAGPPHRTLIWGLAGAGLVLMAGLALMLWPGASEPTHARPANPGKVPFLPAEPTPFLTGKSDQSPAIAYPMPEKPFKGQRKPPCFEGTEVEIRGGCWVQHTRNAPCPRGTAEHQGKCYMPVKPEDPEPTSILP